MNRNVFLVAVLAIHLATIGCSTHSKPPTLVVHAHDNVYDFLDHKGNKIETAKDLVEFEALLKKPKIKNLIRGNRAIVRFKGEPTVNGGMTIPDSLTPVFAKLFGAGATHQEFDYTNK